uniref:Venom toxin n=1 Tax=Hemiscorpius lepturus TaxID=520031 RepID=A0A1L4BJ50_HEMLE|nr:venom toxin [Hemiscorpius lepturus]
MWLRLALICLLGSCVYSLSCPCWRDRENLDKYCGPPPEECALGQTFDACGCCKVCFKTEGEDCGGPWKVYGKCGEGLTCAKPDHPEKLIRDQLTGVCVKKQQ